jgi:hypothetical protein
VEIRRSPCQGSSGCGNSGSDADHRYRSSFRPPQQTIAKIVCSTICWPRRWCSSRSPISFVLLCLYSVVAPYVRVPALPALVGVFLFGFRSDLHVFKSSPKNPINWPTTAVRRVEWLLVPTVLRISYLLH